MAKRKLPKAGQFGSATRKPKKAKFAQRKIKCSCKQRSCKDAYVGVNDCLECCRCCILHQTERSEYRVEVRRRHKLEKQAALRVEMESAEAGKPWLVNRRNVAEKQVSVFNSGNFRLSKIIAVDNFMHSRPERDRYADFTDEDVREIFSNECRRVTDLGELVDRRASYKAFAVRCENNRVSSRKSKTVRRRLALSRKSFLRRVREDARNSIVLAQLID